MKNLLRKSAKKLILLLINPILRKFEHQECMIKTLADANFRTRAMFKRTQNQPINVLFVCHMSALWSMFDSIYDKLVNDSEFNPIVVALPYKHGTLPDGQYKDDGVFTFLQEIGVNVIRGYDNEKDEWLDPATLKPDYVFYQTPYNFFPESWLVRSVSMIAQVCYFPYATSLFRGEVDETVHPVSFFRFTSKFFIESSLCEKNLISRLKKESWFSKERFVISGYPKFDYLTEQSQLSGKAWRRGIREDVRRVLWTPRWNTGEGNCHFFDYKDYFIDFCSKHQNVDFIFRPHPLCLQNLIKTGELSGNDLEAMEFKYSNSQNMALDRNAMYQDTFLSSDILVSDISSMLLEFFATGKPLIYTHRVDVFNELGKKLSEGFYWVRNATELTDTLEMLIAGNDPLKEKRKEIIKSLLYLPKGGASLKIKEAILFDFYDR